VEVVSGLQLGDTVLLGSARSLPEGTVVRIQRDSEVSRPLQTGNATKQP
jgi:hypothetical protein